MNDRGMESDSVFHSLLGCMELLPGLQAVFAIPNMNALPVHCANQVDVLVSSQSMGGHAHLVL